MSRGGPEILDIPKILGVVVAATTNGEPMVESIISIDIGKSVWPTAGDLPGKKSQLDLEPFGIGILSGVWVRLPLISPFFGSHLNSIEQWIYT